MTPVVRFVLGAALLLVVIALGGAAALVWPFLAAMHIEPLEALKAIFGGSR
jgi:hypothetical protein